MARSGDRRAKQEDSEVRLWYSKCFENIKWRHCRAQESIDHGNDIPDKFRRSAGFYRKGFGLEGAFMINKNTERH